MLSSLNSKPSVTPKFYQFSLNKKAKSEGNNEIIADLFLLSETFSTRVFALTANRKRHFKVRRLAFDVYGFYHFSYTQPQASSHRKQDLKR